MLSLLPFHFIPIQIQFNLFSQYVRSVAQSDFTTPECETWMHLNLARHYLTECFRCFRKYVSVNCTLAQMLIPCIDFILSFWALLCVSLSFSIIRTMNFIFATIIILQIGKFNFLNGVPTVFVTKYCFSFTLLCISHIQFSYPIAISIKQRKE